MAETDETIVSFIIFLFILLLFYLKFGKKIIAGEKFKKIKEKIFGQPQQAGQAGIISKTTDWAWKNKLSLVFLIIILVLVGNYVWKSNVPGEVIAFNSSSLSNDWRTVSGNWTVDSCGNLVGFGEIQLNNSEVIKGWSNAVVFPPGVDNLCGQAEDGLSGFSFQLGKMRIVYKIKTAKELGEDDDGSYHTAIIYYENRSLSFSQDKYIKLGDSVGPYPVGFTKSSVPEYTVYILDDNSLFKEQIISYTGTAGLQGSDEGTFVIKSEKVIKIKEIKIYY